MMARNRLSTKRGSVTRRAIKAVSPKGPTRRKTSSASERGSHHVFYPGPWLLSLPIMFGGQFLYVMWSDFTGIGKVLAHACVIASTLGVAYTGWATTRKRSPISLSHTVATIVLAGAWLEWCSWTGWIHWGHSELLDIKWPELTHPTFDAMLVATITLCIAWNIRQNDFVNDATAKSSRHAVEAETVDLSDPWTQAGHPGVKSSMKRINEYKGIGTVYLPPGTVVEDLQTNVARIESVQGWPRKSARFLPDKRDRVNRAEVAVLYKDPLAVSPIYPGLELKRGQTLFDLVPTGIDGDGDVAGIYVAQIEGTKHHLIQGMTGSGKLLRVDTPIPTSYGWTTMGDLKEGDELFDDRGNVCRVTDAFDIQHNHECLDVMFSDGAIISAGPEHLWYTEDSLARLARGLNRRLEPQRVRSGVLSSDAVCRLRELAVRQDQVTISEVCAASNLFDTSSFIRRVKSQVPSCGRQMSSVLYGGLPVQKPGSRLYPSQALVSALIEEGVKPLHDQRSRSITGSVRTTQEIADSLRPSGGAARAEHWNHSIPVSGVLQLPEADLPVPPYVLGAWLGDGTSASGGMTSADPEIGDFIRADGFETGSVRSIEGNAAVQYTVLGLVTKLKTLGLVKDALKGSPSKKHIPSLYLRASESQRRALLAGLMDTDGTPELSGSAVYTSTNKQLAYDVHELCLSLGYRATIREGDAKIDGRFISKCWDISFTTSDAIFHLSRKAQLHKERSLKHNPEKTKHRYIVAVKSAEVASMRCIAVDSPSRLFLAGRHMVPTHNSAGEVPVILHCAALQAQQVIIDTEKKTQTYGDIAEALHWLIIDAGTARSFLRRLVEYVIPARNMQLAREGYKQWHPRSSLKLLRVQIEEAWSLIDTEVLMKISVVARSAGVQLVVSLQRASHDQISTTVRDQLGTRRCYGIQGNFGMMILDNEVIDAGADPTRWADEHPGMHYMQRKGLTIAQKSLPIRAYFDEAKSVEVARSLERKIAPWDAVTSEAFGPLWTNRTLPADLVKNIGSIDVTPSTGAAFASQASAASQAASAGHPVGVLRSVPDLSNQEESDGSVLVLSPATTGEHGEEIEERIVRWMSGGHGMEISGGESDPIEVLFEDPVDPDDSTAFLLPDPEDEIPDRPADRPQRILGRPRENAASKEEFEQKFQARLAELKADPTIDVFNGGHFAEVVVDTRWSRSMIYKQLDALADAGELADLGQYEGWTFIKP